MRRLVATCILLLASIADGHGVCSIERRTEVPVLVWEDHALVELAVNGKAATFLLDTGAEGNVFADTAIGQLGLGRDPWVSSNIGLHVIAADHVADAPFEHGSPPAPAIKVSVEVWFGAEARLGQQDTLAQVVQHADRGDVLHGIAATPRRIFWRCLPRWSHRRRPGSPDVNS